jgi:DNA-binding CsgD family transcriptional regulator
MGHVLAWAAGHDLDPAVRLVTALGWWWQLRGRLAGQRQLLLEVAGRAKPGSGGWCAAQFWLAWMAHDSVDLPDGLQRCAGVIDVIGDREPSQVLVDCLAVQSTILSGLGRIAEAARCGRRALAMARELGYSSGQVHAMTSLVRAARCAGDRDDAVQLARQAGQIPDVPAKTAREREILLAGALADAGDLAAAGQVCAATLARARDAGDLNCLGTLLPVIADLDLRAGRAGDAAAHLREAAQLALQTGTWLTILNVLYFCGYLCAATGRPADAITAWTIDETLGHHGGFAWPEVETRRRDDALRQAQQVLGQDHASTAEQRGAAMSMATAADYALLLTALDPPPAPAAPGAARLSAREWELVTLVAQGHTDADIADQLHISIRTVRTHLDRIRDKTGCRRRADLTRLALSEGLV